MSRQVQAAATIPRPAFERSAGSGGECIISRQDLELLLRGAESERETGYRNLSAGIAASSGFGTVSTVASNFDQLVAVGTAPMESLFLILLSAVTLASSAIAVFFHQRLQAAPSRSAHKALHRQIRERLGDPGADPGYWP